MAQIVVAEIQAYDPTIYGTRTLRYATQGYVTGVTPIADPSLDGRISITRNGNATRYNRLGLVESVQENALRVDYDPITKAIRGLLIEPTRTNLLTYSEQCWDTAQWAVGTGLASFYTATNSTDVPNIYGTTAGVAKFVANPSTAVLFLRKNNSLAANTYAPSIFIYVPAQTGVNNWSIVVDAQDTEQSASITSTTFGRWVRVEVPTFTTAALRTFWDFNIFTNGVQPSPGFTFYAMGPQLEVGSFHTSYIPTFASTATRNEDIARLTGTNFSDWYNQTQGTFFAEGEWGATGAAATRLIQADDGTENDRITLIATSTGSRAIVSDGGPNSHDVSLSTSASVIRAGVAYQANNVISAENGTLSAATTSATMPTLNTLRLGSIPTGVTGVVRIRRVQYWPTRLTNAQLQSLTAGQSIPSGADLDLNFVDGAHSLYEGRVQQPANVARTMYSDRATFGQSSIGYGNLVLVNNDGGLDGLIDYGYSGWPITIRLGEVYPNSGGVPTWSTIVRGTVEQAEFSWQTVTFRVRDRLFDLAQPLQQNRYAGTNTGSPQTGLEGKEDIANKPKPLVFGQVFNVPITLINTDRNIYQAHDGGTLQTVNAVYNRGKTLTAGAAYASQADMETNAPAAGTYRVWNSGSGCFIRLAGNPDGQVTADLTEGSTAADRTVAQVMKRIMLKAGIANADINAADITALDTACSYPVGIYCSTDTDMTGIEALDAVAVSIGAWYCPTGDGTFRLGRLELPSGGTSVGTINAVDVIAVDRVASRDPGAGIPSYKIKLGYQRMWVKQEDLDAAVSQERKIRVKERHRRREQKDNAVKTRYPISPELQFLTCLVNQADADAESTRRLNIYKERRDMLQVKVRVDAALASVLELGKVVTLQLNRYGLSAGKKFLIIGIKTNMRGYLFDLTLWG